jgi:hypothetical protein
MISEAGNFPEVARYHHDAVIVRWMALLGRAYAIGVERGVFRDMDVETVRQLVFFPLLMQAVWKNSMSCCDETRSLPDSYFPTYFEMIFRGLRAAPCRSHAHESPLACQRSRRGRAGRLFETRAGGRASPPGGGPYPGLGSGRGRCPVCG